MADNPLLEVKSALKETYGQRKASLLSGAYDKQWLWKPPESVADPEQANREAGNVIGPALADGGNVFNVIPASRQAGILLGLARDRRMMRRDRIARGGEYIKMLEREIKSGLDARMPK